MAYRMIFSDIDGTLINSAHHVPERTGARLRELHRSGVMVVPVSARSPSGIAPVQQELGFSGTLVAYSGALVLGEEGETLSSIPMDRRAVVEIREICRERPGISCNVFATDRWIVEDITEPWVVQEAEVAFIQPEQGDFLEMLLPDAPVHKLLIMSEADKILALEEDLRGRYPNLAICRSKDTYLEVMEGSVCKSGAVEILRKRYGVPVAETVSFGDNFNDVDMLLATGRGFAMGNAPEEVKRQAPEVTGTNDEEGILMALEGLKFIPANSTTLQVTLQDGNETVHK